MSTGHDQQLNLAVGEIYTVVLRNGFVCNVYDLYTTIKKMPIAFNKDGTVKILSNALYAGNNADYDIVKILDEPLPPLPKGYNWAGGWPTVREIKESEWYLTNYTENYKTYYGPYLNRPDDLRGHKRIALEKIETPSDVPLKDLPVATPQYPIYYKRNTAGRKIIVRTSKDECFYVRNDGTKAQFTWNALDDQAVKSGEYIPASKEEFDAVLKTLVPPPVYGVKPLELKADIVFDMHDFTNFKPDVTTPKSKSRAVLDYFVVEPSVNMARAAANSLRYILLVSVVSTIGYCVTHPSEFKKALPKINFKIEKPEILE